MAKSGELVEPLHAAKRPSASKEDPEQRKDVPITIEWMLGLPFMNPACHVFACLVARGTAGGSATSADARLIVVEMRWSRILFAVAPVVMLVGCRQVFGIDESRGLLPGPTDAAAEAGPVVDGGSPFTVRHAVPSGETLHGIWGAGPDFFVAVGSSSLTFVSDGGALTRLGGTQPGRDYLAVWGFSRTDIFAVGETAAHGGFIDHFDGTGWTSVYDAPTPLLGVWGTRAGGGTVIAVGSEGQRFGRKAGGAWRSFDKLPKGPADPDEPGTPRLWGISGRSLDDFSIAADSRFYHYEPDAGGLAFYEPTTQTNTLFRSVWQAPGDSTSVYLGTNFYGLLWFSAEGSPTQGYPGTVLFRDEQTPGAEKSFIQGVWGTEQKVVAVGDHGRIYVYDTGLSTPSAVPSPTDEPLAAVWGSSIDDVWIVGRREIILHGSVR